MDELSAAGVVVRNAPPKAVSSGGTASSSDVNNPSARLCVLEA